MAIFGPFTNGVLHSLAVGSIDAPAPRQPPPNGSPSVQPPTVSDEEAAKKVFVGTARFKQPDPTTVIRIRGHAPSVKKDKIISFLGSQTDFVEYPGPGNKAVHILVDLRTGSTREETYLEMYNPNAAARLVRRFRGKKRRDGCLSGLGSEDIQIDSASLSDLMGRVFPNAEIDWFGHRPFIREGLNKYGRPFSGFLTQEEHLLLRKMAKKSNRFPLIREAPECPYECLLYIVEKFPWWAPRHITLGQRDELFHTTRTLLRRLRYPPPRPTRTFWTGQLLQQLTHVAMACPGFSMRQRSQLAECADLVKPENTHLIMHLWRRWPFRVVTLSDELDSNEVYGWAAVLRIGWRCLTVAPDFLVAAVELDSRPENLAVRPFGYLGVGYGSQKANRSMKDVGEIEMHAIMQAIKAFRETEFLC